MGRRVPVAEAITFEQLVEYGIAGGAPLVNGMPWSFTYKGKAITHEDDDCYLVDSWKGFCRFERGDWLITGKDGKLYPAKPR